MKAWFLFAPLGLALFLGCESYDRSYVNAGKSSDGKEFGIPPSDVDRYAKENGVSREEALHRLNSAAPPSAAAPGPVRPSANPSASQVDLASLRVGTPCRIDLVRPAGKGQAYEGTVVRIEQNAVVLGNVISEGPVKRSMPADFRNLISIRAPWSAGEESIDWQKLPDKEVRVAKSEIAATRVLDHDPLVDFYQR